MAWDGMWEAQRQKQLDKETYQFDIFVIGGGSGGLSCSKASAKHGKKVGVADFVTPSPQGSTWGLGGTCVNVGCIPKKLMHQAALLGEAVDDSKSFGWTLDTEKKKHDWKTMVQNVQDHIGSLNYSYENQLMDTENITYYNKQVSLQDKHTLTLTDRQGKVETVTAKHIVLAMGGRPVYPDVPGIRENSITSDDVFSLKNPPGKTLVVGASYISLECAGFLRGLGYDVTVMVRSIFLRGFDQEMANKVAQHMEENTMVKFLRGYNIKNTERMENGQVRVTFGTGEGGVVAHDYDTVLMATGRKPLTEGIGLEGVGVALTDKGFVITDKNDRTNVENIFAIGDIAEGKPELTPVAIQAGQLLADRLSFTSTEQCDYINVPTTVFTPLEYGACGYSEEDAVKMFGEENVEVYHNNFTPLETVVTPRKSQGFAKIITTTDDRVVGIHVLGPNAGEVVQGFSIALKLGAKKKDFDRLIGIHPTNAEVFTTMSITKRSGIDIGGEGCEG